MASTVPSNFWSKASTETVTDWPGCICLNWLSLKFAVTHKSPRSATVMSLCPLLTCSPTSTVRLLTTPGHRRNDLAIAEIELRLVHLRLHRLHVRLLRLQIRPGNGDLIGRIHVGHRHPAVRLIELRLALLHHFLRGFCRGARRIHRSGQRLRRARPPDRIASARLRFCPPALCSAQRRPAPWRYSLPLPAMRDGAADLIALRGGDTRFGVGDFGLARRHAGLRSALRDRQIWILARALRLGPSAVAPGLAPARLDNRADRVRREAVPAFTDWFSST